MSELSGLTLPASMRGEKGGRHPSRPPMFGAGLTTPPTPFRGPGRTAGLRPGSGLESLGLRSGKVRRPCHNFADFRGGAICLFRTHFLGWSGRFFHGFLLDSGLHCDGSFPRTRAPVPAARSGEPLGTDAEPGPSLSDGVGGPSHRFPECGMGNSECGMRKKYELN